MKNRTKSVKLLAFFCCLIVSGAKAQDTTYYDQNYEPVRSRLQAQFMELKKCAADNQNRCSVGTFLLENNQIIFNSKYSDYDHAVRHGRCSKWYQSGALHWEMMYEEGKKHGVEKVFYPNGQLKKELRWEQDSLKGGLFFHEDGTPKTEVFKEDLEETEEQTEPSFPGGELAMYKYLSQTVRYPEQAKEEGISGQVVLIFVVNKSGEISNIEVFKTPHPILSDAVLKSVAKMPRWLPARVSGIPVRVRYTMPFKFKLE